MAGPNSARISVTSQIVTREVKHLPSAAKVLPRLKRLLHDSNSDMAEIVALIRLDAAIATRVIHVGNSVYFGKGARCSSVEEAVNRVGYTKVYELVSFAVASQVLVRPLAVYGIEPDALWERSVTMALAAEVLAECTGQERDIAYTIGLLHALGMVAINEWAHRHKHELKLPMDNSLLDATAAERGALGFIHADVGAELLRAWGFPAEFAEPLRWQYAPLSANSFIPMACLVQIARWVSHAAHGRVLDVPLQAIFEPLGLDPAELNEMAERVTARLADVHSTIAVDEAGSA
jgi:HD-like signal output (HDOD) protein